MSAWMQRWGGWLVAGLLTVIGGGLWLWYVLRGQTTEAGRQAVELLEAWHAQDVKSTRAHLAKLKSTLDASDVRIRQTEEKLKVKRTAIKNRYEKYELDSEEVDRRLADLGL